jgi:hypothetical protein
MKCRVAISGTFARAEFDGHLTDNSKRLTLTVLDLRMNLDDGLLVEDATIGKMCEPPCFTTKTELEIDPEFRRIIEAWETLPPHIRAAMIALLRSCADQ